VDSTITLNIDELKPGNKRQQIMDTEYLDSDLKYGDTNSNDQIDINGVQSSTEAIAESADNIREKQ